MNSNVRERVASFTATFEEQDTSLRSTDPLRFDGYEIPDAEACVWGWSQIEGVRAALVVFDFDVLGGSMGMVVGEKVARAFDAAQKERAPVVTVTASGGARMQEGMWSLMQMAKTVEARRRHKGAGLAHVTLLTSPTTGGVYASFASLADVVFGEPDATVGFAGPRVVAQMTGETPPADVHKTEWAFAHGLIDAIVASDEAPAMIARALRALSGTGSERRMPLPNDDGERAPEPNAWERVQMVRAGDRVKGRAILDTVLHDTVELRGDRQGGADDEHVVVLIGSLIDGTAAVAVAQDAIGDGRIRPSGFRKSIRAFDLAGRLGLPVVVVIDTRGADPLPDSEGAGVAVAIAQTFEALLGCPSPTVAVLTGEGGSGGALAMAVADRVIASEHAVFSVIAPEGAAAILYRDAHRAPELADRLRITAADLQDLGLVDLVVPEVIPTSAAGVGKPQVNVTSVARAVAEEVARLREIRPRKRLGARARRYRRAASPSRRSGR